MSFTAVQEPSLEPDVYSVPTIFSLLSDIFCKIAHVATTMEKHTNYKND